MEGALLASRSQPERHTGATAASFDRAAFTSLVARYQADLLRVCYVILGDKALAEDAAQSAWVQAWRKLDQLRDDDKVRSWLLAVAANEARQLARRRRRAPPSVAAAGFAAHADPRLADLTAALARLSTDDRRLLALRYVAELTSEQIGDAIGISGGAVRHRLMRLLARLRVDLDR
jgi:RNA polymerase sigma-70 factor (ECF subfamily)